MRFHIPVLAVVMALAPAVACASFEAVTAAPVIIDGDTFDIGTERIRLKGPDAPESHKARCAAEQVVAKQATNRLQQLLAAGPITIQRDGIDRYGRTLAVVMTGGVDVGEALIAEGLAVRWQPGRRAWAERARHWCPGFTE